MRPRIVGASVGAGKSAAEALRRLAARLGTTQDSPPRVNLSIVHYHFRPGGVRRVIELAAPHIVRKLRADSITLITGERPPAPWLRVFRGSLAGVKVRVFTDAVLGYAEKRVSGTAVRAALDRALAGSALVWAHNLALGRNLTLSHELTAHCEVRDRPLIAHHHDWWCDRRWSRWPVIRRCGFRTLRAVALAVFPAARRIAHVAINEADARILQRHFPGRAHWLPNLIDRPAPAKRSPGRGSPIWLMPCRILRRKNIAEALLLTRWLRPEATLVVTGTADEIDERDYATTLAAASLTHRWPLRLGAGSVEKFTAQAEAIVFTSIQEGFGLPQLEAAAAGLPAIIRRVPLVAPDLTQFGFRFPQTYDEILIAPDLFDWRAEAQRQTQSFRAWRAQLPRSIRALVEWPALHAPRPVAFSRLTLSAQLEVLRHDSRESWTRSAPLNPFLREWREQAARGELKIAAWPRSADTHLSAPAYARHFAKIAGILPDEPASVAEGLAAQEDFIRARLSPSEMHPLLWPTR